MQGISVESVCNSLRQLPQLKGMVNEEVLYVMCAIKTQEHDSMEITLVRFSSFVISLHSC